MATDGGKKVRNLVLVGKTGNGKSATGNSILGLISPTKKYTPPEDVAGFVSLSRPAGVTQTTQMKNGTVNGQTINVIDTPGLFDSALAHKVVTDEIVKCMQWASGGIHAFLGVLSTNRFTEEEAKAFDVLEGMFGSKALDYMILVFTNRSPEIEDMDDLDDYYLRDAPQSLKNILDKCKHRKVLIDNTSKEKREKQRSEILFLVNQVVAQNHGQPYTNDLIKKLQQEEIKRREAEKEMAAARERSEIEKYQAMKRKLEKETEEQIIRITKETRAKLENEMRRQKSQECCSVM